MPVITGLSQCQLLCIEDCSNAIANTESPDGGLSIVGKCPKDCSTCLYAERFERGDTNWIPQPNDPQYHHWLTR